MEKEIIGYLALGFLQLSALLQIIRFIKVKKTTGVSVYCWWSICIGLALFTLYSLLIKDRILVISNGLGVLQTGASVFLYYYYRRKEKIKHKGKCLNG